MLIYTVSSNMLMVERLLPMMMDDAGAIARHHAPLSYLNMRSVDGQNQRTGRNRHMTL
jgi:hypothetical protein